MNTPYRAPTREVGPTATHDGKPAARRVERPAKPSAAHVALKKVLGQDIWNKTEADLLAEIMVA